MTQVFEISAASIDAMAARAAGWLARAGMRGGDRIVVPASNEPRLLALTHGALRSGVIPVLVNPSLDAGTRAWIEKDAEPAAVIRSLDQVDWEGQSADLAPVPIGRPMLYTSGTTGRPKGVWCGVLDESRAREWASDEQDLWAPDSGRTTLVCSPLYHSAGHRLATAALIAGARLLLLERFEPETVVRIMAEEAVSTTFFVPTQLRRILDRGMPAQPRAAGRILHAGEPCPPDLKRNALRWLPDLWEFYGSTEGQFTAISPDEWRARPGSVGRARRGRTLRVIDAASDGIGSVFVSAPPFARWEYWRDPEATAAAWRDDTFTAGDLGRVDDDGYLTLASRRDDLIITGGVNVYPAMLEAALLEQPGITDAAVFGIDDDEWGQRVCAAVVAEGPVDSIVAELFHGAYRPKLILRLDVIPRTGIGKVDRIALRRMVAG